MAGEHVIVWRFRVEAGSATAFERAYGPAGPWARLFGRHPGYPGSELVRGDEPGAYLTIDRWAPLRRSRRSWANGATTTSDSTRSSPR